MFEEVYSLTKQGRYEAAISLLYQPHTHTIVETFSDDQNHAWYLLADLFYKKKDLEQSKHCFRKALDYWSEDVDAYLGLANILHEQGNHDDAVITLRQALAFSADARLIYNYANLLFDQHRYAEAIQEYKRIDDSNPRLLDLAKKNRRRAEQLIQKEKN